MKIDRVLMSCDDNPLYVDFWEPVSKVWTEKMGIVPTLLYFGTGTPSERYGEVVKFEDKSKHPSYLKTLWSRYWYPSTCPDMVFCISDIDMIPLNKHYFTDTIESIPNTAYVNLVEHMPLPSCYHVAKGKLFKYALELPDSFEESLDLVSAPDLAVGHPEFDFPHWGSDEVYATRMIVSKFRSGTIDFRVVSRKPYEGRLDRSNWNYDAKNISSGRYLDCHSIRPYSTHREEIDKLIEMIP